MAVLLAGQNQGLSAEPELARARRTAVEAIEAAQALEKEGIESGILEPAHLADGAELGEEVSRFGLG